MLKSWWFCVFYLQCIYFWPNIVCLHLLTNLYFQLHTHTHTHTIYKGQYIKTYLKYFYSIYLRYVVVNVKVARSRKPNVKTNFGFIHHSSANKATTIHGSNLVVILCNGYLQMDGTFIGCFHFGFDYSLVESYQCPSLAKHPWSKPTRCLQTYCFSKNSKSKWDWNETL
jgi:hypothetical protein